MSEIVLDSSVLAKLVLPEADSAQARRCVFDAVTMGRRAWALDLALIECANAIWVQHRRGFLDELEINKALHELELAAIDYYPGAVLIPSAMEIALRFDCAIYDALFVSLSIELGSTGITADEPLHRKVAAAYPNIRLLRDFVSP
jgi:predicted nucleic acid-binding protein